MKLKFAKNSLFAILLRSPWWISLLIVVGIALVSVALLPAPYVPFGVIGGFPFLVIGIMAAWRQRHAPSPARTAEVLGHAAGMSWRDFSGVIERAFVRQGYTVTRLTSTAADFSLLKGARVTLVSCKRWKAARHGVEALRDLFAAKQAQGADECTYISLAPVTENARRYAAQQGVQLMFKGELAQLLVDEMRP